MPRSPVCGQSETIREGYRGTSNAFGFLSAWRQPCFAGFVNRPTHRLKPLQRNALILAHVARVPLFCTSPVQEDP
jgi:hypothetical protein